MSAFPRYASFYYDQTTWFVEDRPCGNGVKNGIQESPISFEGSDTSSFLNYKDVKWVTPNYMQLPFKETLRVWKKPAGYLNEQGLEIGNYLLVVDKSDHDESEGHWSTIFWGPNEYNGEFIVMKLGNPDHFLWDGWDEFSPDASVQIWHKKKGGDRFAIEIPLKILKEEPEFANINLEFRCPTGCGAGLKDSFSKEWESPSICADGQFPDGDRDISARGSVQDLFGVTGVHPNNYFFYKGSDVVPGCEHDVHWMLFPKVIGAAVEHDHCTAMAEVWSGPEQSLRVSNVEIPRLNGSPALADTLSSGLAGYRPTASLARPGNWRQIQPLLMTTRVEGGLMPTITPPNLSKSVLSGALSYLAVVLLLF